MDVMPAPHVEEVVKKYAGAKLWSFPETFKFPTENIARLMFSPINTGNPSYPEILRSWQIPARWLENSAFQMFNLQGKRIFPHNPAGAGKGIYFIQPSSKSASVRN
jgi:hypothetical protein